MLLEELEGGGHLFQVVDLGPPLIGRAFTLAHFLLNVNQQIDALGHGPGPRLFGLARGGLAVNHGLNVLPSIASPQGGCPEPGRPVMVEGAERDHSAPPMHHLDARRLHAPEEISEVGGAFGQGRIYGPAYLFLLGRGPGRPLPLSIMQKAALAVELGPLYHGQRVFQAYPVRQPPQGKAGADEVAEFPGAVIGRGIVVNVIVNVALIGMGADKKLIFSLCPAHRRFIADPVGLLRGDFPLGKGLADLVAQRPLLRRPARFRLILALYQHKFSVGGFRVAEVGGHRPQLFRVQAIVKTVFQALNGRPLGGLFVGLDVGRGRGHTPLSNSF